MPDGLFVARFARSTARISAFPDGGGVLPSASRDLPDRQKLAGPLVVFTGKLSALRGTDAPARISSRGGAAAEDVSAKTTMLVIGDEGFGATRQGVDGSDDV